MLFEHGDANYITGQALRAIDATHHAPQHSAAMTREQAAQFAFGGITPTPATATHRPHIVATANGTDQFKADAVDALLFTATQGRRGSRNKLAAIGHGAILRGALRAHGVDASGADLTDVAKATLEMAAQGLNRVGDFPNIMSAVSAVLMDSAADLSEVSYPRIAEELIPADSMDGVSIGGFGVIDSLDAHVDGDDVKEKKLTEESKGYLAPIHYANDVTLTWMMASDPLKFAMFLEALAELALAGPRQLNRAIIDGISANIPTIDGIDLFDVANHGNLVTPGGAPSDTNLEANRVAHAAQIPPGAANVSGADPRIVLVPDALKITAQRAFRTLLGTGGMVVANVEQTQSYFKDGVEVIADPMLDPWSTSRWYSLVSPMNRGLRSIVYRYLRGHGPDRPMIQYHDHRKRGLVFGVDFVAGWSLTRHRGIVRNGA